MKIFRRFLILLILLPFQAYAFDIQEIQATVAAGDYQLALERVNVLIRENPQDADARFLRGVIHAQLGHTERAIAIFNTLTGEFPDLAEPYNNLAVLYASRKNYTKARDALERAISIQPDYDTGHENLGDIYSKMAALEYERSASINEQNIRSRSKSDIIAKMLNKRVSRNQMVTVVHKPVEIKKPEVQTIEVEVSRPAMTSTQSRACFEVGPIRTEPELEMLSGWLMKQKADVDSETRQQSISTYKVYIAPFKHRKETIQNIKQLKQKGVKDIIIIPAGDLKNAISVGIFSYHTSALKRQKFFNNLGYDTRILDMKTDLPRYWLNVSTSINDEKHTPQLFKQKFKNYKIQTVSCR